MDRARQIAANSVALLLSNTANKITGFLIMLSVTRFLGVERLGLYTYVFTYVGTLALATDLGLTTVVIRGLSRNHDSGRLWLGTALLLRWPLALIIYVISAGGGFLLYGFEERAWLIALSSLSFFSVPLTTYGAVLQATMRQYMYALVNLASKILLFIAIQWIARNQGSLAILLSTEVVLGALTGLVIWLLSRPLLQARYSFDWKLASAMLHEGVPLFLSSVFIALYFRIDVFFLKHYNGDAAIGIYAAAYRITEAFPVLASSLANSIFPALCEFVHSDSREASGRLIQTSMKILAVISIPLTLVLAFHGGWVVQILYGRRFEAAAPLLSILVLGQIFVFTNILLTNLLVARGESRSLMGITISMLAINLVLNYLVIPIYGAAGASVTTVLTEMAGFVACLWRTSMGRRFWSAVVRILFPALIIFVVLYLFTTDGSPFALASLWPLFAVIILYPLSLFIFHVFDFEERRRIRTIVRL